MRKIMFRNTAFFLITVLLCCLFGGCGEAVPKTTEETAERLLTKGYYAVYDADDVLTAYAEVKSTSVILYDTEGHEKDDYKLSFDPVKDEYKLDYEEVFTVRERRSGLSVTFESKEKYRLESITESELPVPSTKQALATTEAPTEPPTTEAPTEPPATEAPTEPPTEAPTEPLTEAPTEPPTEAPTEPAVLTAQQVYELAQPSTVDITAIVSDNYYYTGTGFFDDENGTVITNYHVIEGTVDGYITTADGDEYDIIAVLGYDEDKDIAILATDMPASIPLVKREKGAVTGETVYALGSSLGLTGTFSNGIISTAKRDDGDGHIYIQHTAAISQGNSGGPLLDEKGQVIGIVCAYINGGQNLNLAIPIAEVETVSRNVGLSLKQLYEAQNGYAPGDPVVTTDDWKAIYLTGNTERYVAGLIPPEMYDNMVVNEEETGLETSIKTDHAVLYLATEYESADYSEVDLDALIPALSGVIEDSLTSFEEMGLVMDPIECQTLTLNGTEWYLFFTAGESETYETAVDMLVYKDDEYVMMILLVGALEDSDSYEEDAAMIGDTLYNIVASLQVGP